MMGFMNRVTQSFQDVEVYKTLYFSYVRSRLEYCSQVWAPTKQVYIKTIERVQRKFIKKLCFLKNVPYESTNYLQLCDDFRVKPLYARRNVADVLYFQKVLLQKVSCSYLISEIVLYAPERPLRHGHGKCLFFIKCRTCTRKDSYMPRVMSLLNKNDCIDPFIDSSIDLKRTLNAVFF